MDISNDESLIAWVVMDMNGYGYTAVGLDCMESGRLEDFQHSARCLSQVGTCQGG